MNHGALLYSSSPKPNIVPPDISATKRSFGADHPRPQTPVRFSVGIRNRGQNCCFVRVSGGGGGGNRRSGKVFSDVKSVDKFEKELNDVVSGKADLEVESVAEVSWLQEFPKRWVIVVLCFSAFLLCNMDRLSLKLEALTTMNCVVFDSLPVHTYTCYMRLLEYLWSRAKCFKFGHIPILVEVLPNFR
ncbi:sodium-dependent phosphate transport protein 1 [Pyrus ussuriensis x Pyrus communis]|uniref:Sodium-dependent phosphate transport protein 1 n=1 Tax=Pyrus ussuriensis x Pyrus communis TaxID=2448454 RepID=A0A5N5FVI0_9ROSA|nr:sodium-dependent phosphate transport protein 1 [Pyrus ussuriensis x Pyrus communis]